jgi:hypothetical protein
MRNTSPARSVSVGTVFILPWMLAFGVEKGVEKGTDEFSCIPPGSMSGKCVCPLSPYRASGILLLC